MLRSLLVISFLALPIEAAAQARVDVDRHADFAQYRTFDIAVGPLVRADGTPDEHNTLAEDRLRRAVASELAARGLESTSAGADLLVRVSSRDTERTQVVSSGFPYYPTYRYRPFRLRNGRIAYLRTYDSWSRPFYDDVWTRRYLEGALTLDILERETGRLVFRAQVNREVGSDLEKYVAKSVDRAFKEFPVKERRN